MAKNTKHQQNKGNSFNNSSEFPDYSQPGQDFEIGDVENYRSDGMQVFNHQILVMAILQKVQEAGSHELRAGWFNEKLDNGGNIIRTYIEDTREKYISCVRTAITVMTCDFDDKAKENINKVLKKIKEMKKQLLKEQWEWYTNQPPKYKILLEGKISKSFFNTGYGWYFKAKELEVEFYFQIAKELHSLTKRIDFYQSQDFEG